MFIHWASRNNGSKNNIKDLYRITTQHLVQHMNGHVNRRSFTCKHHWVIDTVYIAI